ncbi:MAG: hypothetical protein ACKOTE_15190, partial [Opitutaceae bacterium]
ASSGNGRQEAHQAQTSRSAAGLRRETACAGGGAGEEGTWDMVMEKPEQEAAPPPAQAVSRRSPAADLDVCA